MNSQIETRGNIARAASVFAAAILIVWLIPGGRLVAFPYQLLAVQDSTHQWHHLLSPDRGRYYNVLQWVIATTLFAFGARKIRLAVLVPVSLAAICVVTVATHIVVNAAGMGFYWDLWH